MIVSRPESLYHGYRKAGFTIIPFDMPPEPYDAYWTAVAA